jgi:hypothetical protein
LNQSLFEAQERRERLKGAAPIARIVARKDSFRPVENLAVFHDGQKFLGELNTFAEAI